MPQRHPSAVVGFSTIGIDHAEYLGHPSAVASEKPEPDPGAARSQRGPSPEVLPP